MIEVKDKEQLQETLVATIERIKSDKKRVTRIKKGLKEYNVLPGTVQLILNAPEEQLKQIDDKFLCLLTEQIYIVSGNLELNPEKYFSKREIKEVKSTYEYINELEKVDFPYTFKPAIKVDEDVYTTVIKASELKMLMDNKLLQYNFLTQREAIEHFNKTKSEIVREIKIYKKHMEQIKKSILKGEALPSTLTFNARLGTADEGVELIYNEETLELTVTEGTLLDCLDGYHRVTAIVKAFMENPEIDMKFMLTIVNYDIPKAAQYFTQINTIMPVAKTHLRAVSKTRESEFIVDQLRYNSVLKNRIATTHRIAPKSDLLVTFTTLADAIDDVYTVENRAEAIKLSRYLKKFFEELFYAFPDEFLGDVAQVREKSLINANAMFYGYIALSKRMKDKNVPLEKIYDILKNIDFSRENKMWEDINAVDEDGRITNKGKKKLKEFFEQIDLDVKEGDIYV